MSEKKQKGSKPWVNCENCGEKVKIVDPEYPQSYVCDSCGHVFTWVARKKS
jgi:uncharacterized Zn finger protein